MKKLLKILFILLFFNCLTHASSNTIRANKLNSSTSNISYENKNNGLLDNANSEIHPLYILDFRFK